MPNKIGADHRYKAIYFDCITINSRKRVRVEHVKYDMIAYKNEYLNRVKRYIEKYRGKLYAYVMMDNHCHMLIEVSDIPLSKIMQLIQQTYTSWYNKTYKRSGHVFEQRYNIDTIKGKYLNGDILKQRNIFIKEVLKYKALNQSELANFLGVSHHLISKVWNS